MQRVTVVARHLALPCSAPPAEVANYPEGKHYGSLANYERPIYCPSAGFLSAESMPPSLYTPLLGQSAAHFPNDVALMAEKPTPQPEAPGVAPSLPREAWKKWTFADYHRDACNAAKAFAALGVEQFGSVSIFGFNAPEWLISAFGAMLCGGKYVGIYLTDTPDQTQFKVMHSSSAVVVVDGKFEFDAVMQKLDEMPCVKAVVVWGMPAEGLQSSHTVQILHYENCLRLGAEQSDTLLDARMAAQRPGHALSICYTSGTTGNPKGVMIHHDGVAVQGKAFAKPDSGLLPGFEGGARVISYLPLSHVAGGLMDILNPIYFSGAEKLKGTIYFARPYDLKEMTLASRIQFVRPTLFLGVPRVYEKIQARMMAVSATITGIKKSLATWAKGKGLEYARNQQMGGSGSAPFFHSVADKLVLSKAREALGLDQCKTFIVGAAPISVDTLEYFGALGMMLRNVYGMSESSGCSTFSTPSKTVFGTVGTSLPGIEVKCFRTESGENVEVPACAPGMEVVPEEMQGELCYRGRNIMMGYMANPDFGQAHVEEIEKKNREAIDKWGWLHSGDKGCIDARGMVRITGRYKEIIIGAGGENIAPVPVEDNVKKLCPALSNVMMIGDQRQYNIMLVTLLAEGANGEVPGTDDLLGAALMVNPTVTTVSAALKDPKWQDYIQSGIDATNNDPLICRSNAWKVQKFAIIPRDFSVATGEFTPTLKLKRSVSEGMWKEVIDSLYS